jgi:predicted XRE-type DNA-binding protein
MQEPIVQSSGNIFTDLGFDRAEAAILQLRSKPMGDLCGFINAKQLTQAQAVEQMVLPNLEFLI